MASAEAFDGIHRAYARRIIALAGVADTRVERAFAAIHREDFLGPAPWPIVRFGEGYVRTSDPAQLYSNDLVAISPERGINNGQPSLHAHLLACAAPAEGDHVVHIGAGLGYYSTIMAHMVGPSGRVTAIEFEPDLAARATANLAGQTNVTVVHGDGSIVAFDPADVIYVNAGATRPADAWLDRMTEGGRLVLPLTTDPGFSARQRAIERRGAVFVITRTKDGFLARWVSPVSIYPCHGMRDAASERALADAFDDDGWTRVTRLYRTDAVPAERCWLRAPGWCLAYE